MLRDENKNLDNNPKQFYITLLYVLSSVAVVMYHTNDIVHGIFGTYYEWIYTFFINGLFTFAVPIFFMLSGANLIGYRDRYNLPTYINKRIKKVFIPFIFWSFVVLFCNTYIHHWIEPSSINLKYIIYGIYYSSFSPIYWFFIQLFYVYIIIAFLGFIPKDKRLKIVTFLFFIIFYINCYVNEIMHYEYNKIVTIFCLTYTLLGYILANVEIQSKYRKFIYFLSIIGLFTYIIGTVVLSNIKGYIAEEFYGYNHLPCFFYSLGVFVFIKYNGLQICNYIKCINIINWLKNYTLAIYLTHIIIMDITVLLFGLNRNCFTYRYGTPIIFVILCIIVTNIIRKMKIGNYILPK